MEISVKTSHFPFSPLLSWKQAAVNSQSLFNSTLSTWHSQNGLPPPRPNWQNDLILGRSGPKTIPPPVWKSFFTENIHHSRKRLSHSQEILSYPVSCPATVLWSTPLSLPPNPHLMESVRCVYSHLPIVQSYHL